MTEQTESKQTLIYILALAQFATPFMLSGVGITLPAMGRELHASGVSLGLVEIIYLGAASAFLLPIGHFADLTDKVLIFKIGLCIYTISTMIIGFLPSVPTIIGLRFIQGFAGALIMSTNMAILTNSVPRAQLGKAIGINVGAVYLGLSAGPFIAGWITNHYGWRWVFHSTFIPLIFAFILIQLNLKSNWKRRRESFDWLGTITIIIAIFLLIFGSSMMGEHAYGYLLTGAGLLFTILFFIFESRASHPLINLQKIKSNASLSAALVIQLMMYAGAFGISFLTSLYLQIVKGLSPQAAGQVLVVSPVVMAILAPICGRLADRFSPRVLATIGLVFSLVSTMAATRINGDTGLVYLIGVLVTQGIGFAMFSSPNMAIIMNSVQPNEYGIASALSANMRSLGMVLSMMIITVFMSFYLGTHMIDTHPAEFLSVMHSSFFVFALFAGGGTVLSLLKTSV